MVPVNLQPVAETKTGPALINCYCDLAVCGDQKMCTTRYGCFSELQPVMPGADNDTVAEPTASQPVDDAYVFSNRSLNGTYGCLEMLSM